MKYYNLDDEEKQIEQDYEKDQFVPVKNAAKEKKKFEQAAKATLNKTKNINIRLSVKSLLKLKAKAASSGIPYQTLAASIIHQFTTKNNQRLSF